MKNTDKKEITNYESISKRIALFRQFVNPNRDWIVLLIFIFVLLLSSLYFDYNIYRKTTTGDMYISVAKDELVIENLKTDQIQNILNIFQDKKNQIKNLKLEKLVDPSL